MLARRETVKVRIYIAEAKLHEKKSDADSVIKVTFTFIFLSKMMKINWPDYFKYYANVPFNMKQIINVLIYESYQLLIMIIFNVFFLKSTFAIMMIKDLMQNQYLQNPSLLGSNFVTFKIIT